MNAMNLGNAIKSLRAELKNSRKELAGGSENSITALNNIEKNLSLPSKDKIQSHCKSFGVPVSFLVLYLLTEEDVPEEKRGFFKMAVEPVKEFLMGKYKFGPRTPEKALAQNC